MFIFIALAFMISVVAFAIPVVIRYYRSERKDECRHRFAKTHCNWGAIECYLCGLKKHN